MKSKFINLAALGLLALSTVSCKEQKQAEPSSDASAEEMVKCYGVAKKGKNDCASANGKHGCEGESITDNDPCEWALVKKSVCESESGTTQPVNCIK